MDSASSGPSIRLALLNPLIQYNNPAKACANCYDFPLPAFVAKKLPHAHHLLIYFLLNRVVHGTYLNIPRPL